MALGHKYPHLPLPTKKAATSEHQRARTVLSELCILQYQNNLLPQSQLHPIAESCLNTLCVLDNTINYGWCYRSLWPACVRCLPPNYVRHAELNKEHNLLASCLIPNYTVVCTRFRYSAANHSQASSPSISLEVPTASWQTWCQRRKL
jgi:hypothetical protein